MKYNNFLRSVVLILIVFSSSLVVLAQYKGLPVKKEKLVSVLRSRQLQTREIVAVIKSNGVDFRVTDLVEAELKGAGARPEVIAAAKANYRASVATPVQTGSSTPSKTFTGQPMTKDVIVTLLNNGISDAQVRSNVTTRGVNFKPSPSDKNEIKEAGGTAALIALIDKSYNNPNQGSAGNNDTGGGGGSYDALVDKAVNEYDTQKNVSASISTLQAAIALNASESRAYQLLGFSYLYGQKNFAEAEKYMKLAIDRGGSAVFRVFHDHGALMTDTCTGSLFIAKDTVRYESDDNIHTFETSDGDIKEAKMANKFASMFNVRQGSFKIALKSGENASKNYNFAPATNDSQESKMIIRMIGK
ncbi:MAG TPA: hypothetical protein PLL77_00980 [Pyrinomonadaceae bacterium]|nr:hypothetical protein [Pyrinomonadaceae bacterium]